MSVWTMATPALVLDAEIMEVNLKRMAEHTRAAQVGFRPYVTTHKCPVIARRQLELGAAGIAVAKISEAEVMAEGGLENILITSPVVTRGKLARLLALVREHPKVQIVVDQRENVRDLNDAAASVGLTLSVFVDFNMGADRTGIFNREGCGESCSCDREKPGSQFGWCASVRWPVTASRRLGPA